MTIIKQCEDCKVDFKSSKYSSQTRCRKCSVKHRYAMKTPEEKAAIKEKRKQTNLERYGVEHAGSLPENIEKAKKTKEELYGKDAQKEWARKASEAAASEESKEKRRKTFTEKYGGPSPFYDKEILKQCWKSRIENNDIPFSAPKYQLGDIQFDSSWELAFFMWLTDQGKQFIYHPNMPLYYTGDDGKEHCYHTDFLVEGKFYEIKGNQFFDKDGNPVNCYTGKSWKTQYDFEIAAGVIILREDDVKPYLKYVHDKYGPTFIKDHKLKKKDTQYRK